MSAGVPRMCISTTGQPRAATSGAGGRIVAERRDVVDDARPGVQRGRHGRGIAGIDRDANRRRGQRRGSPADTRACSSSGGVGGATGPRALAADVDDVGARRGHREAGRDRASASMKSPPSLKLSGVTFSTPMTRGRSSDRPAQQPVSDGGDASAAWPESLDDRAFGASPAAPARRPLRVRPQLQRQPGRTASAALGPVGDPSGSSRQASRRQDRPYPASLAAVAVPDRQPAGAGGPAGPSGTEARRLSGAGSSTTLRITGSPRSTVRISSPRQRLVLQQPARQRGAAPSMFSVRMPPAPWHRRGR